MKVFTGIDELKAAVGTHLGYSEWHTITQEQINQFAEATGDRQWIHVDLEKATQGPFGGPIAHGYLTLSLVPMLSWEVFDVQGISMGVNYGANKVRFPAPVPVGSRVRGGVELLSCDGDERGYQAVNRITIEIEGAEKPACVVDTVSVLVP
jgi:acyl dehydratase